MRQLAVFSLVFSVALLSLGCGTSSSPTPNANDKVRDAGDAAVEAAKAKRDEAVRDFQKGLDVLDTKLKALEQRAVEAKGDARKDLDEKVKVAKAKRDAAARKLDELKGAGADRWEKVKDGVGDAFDDLKKIFD